MAFLARLKRLLLFPFELRAQLLALNNEVASLRREVHDRLLQNTLVLTRASRALEARAEGDEQVRLAGRSVPMQTPDGEMLPWAPLGEGAEAPDPDGREWLTLDRCSTCESTAFTVVNPWNKFVLLDKAPNGDAARYDYAVCQACGVLFATRRPTGGRYRFLLENFGEVTAKRGGTAEITDRVLNPYPLTDTDRDELRRLGARGAFVSDHLGLSKTEFLPPLMRDRLGNSPHTDIIGALLSPRGFRVLEVRSRAGSILDGLRHAWGAEVYAMPIWESQQFLLEEVYGIPTSTLIDFDHFRIPFEGRFDLIICNHMFTHALRPREFFGVIRSHLKPGGHVYLHNEPDDAEFLSGNQTMLATLNPLHMQAFDPMALARGMAANGFEPIFVKRQKNEALLCLARMSDAAVLTPMTPKQCQTRVEQYRSALDRAVLSVDERIRPRVASVWPAAVEHAVASGTAEFDERGRVRVVAR